jgi:hypothetical protein
MRVPRALAQYCSGTRLDYVLVDGTPSRTREEQA